MNDSTIKALVGAGLLLQAAAVALGFTSLGWRWPLVAATALIALGMLAVRAMESSAVDPPGMILIGFSIGALGAAAWHAASLSPAAAWTLRAAFGLEALALLALLAFLLLFRLNRLW